MKKVEVEEERKRKVRADRLRKAFLRDKREYESFLKEPDIDGSSYSRGEYR